MNSNTISNFFQGSDANNDFSDSLVKESVVGLINFTCDQRGAPSNQILIPVQFNNIFLSKYLSQFTIYLYLTMVTTVYCNQSCNC